MQPTDQPTAEHHPTAGSGAEERAVAALDQKDKGRLSWLETELSEDPYRPVWGVGVPKDTKLCRNGHEITELRLEVAELKLKGALMSLATPPAGSGEREGLRAIVHKAMFGTGAISLAAPRCDAMVDRVVEALAAGYRAIPKVEGELRKKLHQAACDPGSIVGYKNDRSVGQWMCDAIDAVLSATPRLPAQEDRAPEYDINGALMWNPECYKELDRHQQVWLLKALTENLGLPAQEGVLRERLLGVCRKEGVYGRQARDITNAILAALATLSPTAGESGSRAT